MKKSSTIIFVLSVLAACVFGSFTADARKHTPLQTRHSFVRTKVDKGLDYYYYRDLDDVSGAMQTVYVTCIDLDSDRYDIKFVCGSDSTSAVAKKYGALAAINATYERDASYIRVDGENLHEVSIPSDHLRFWKHDGAITSDGGSKVAIIFGASDAAATPEGGEKAIGLYKSLTDKNVFSGSPMLIDDYQPVGTDFVPADLTEKDLKQLSYEDYRRHQGVRHPRTAVALTADNDLLLIVVDGRRKDAVGMSAKELTLFLAKHFNPRWALNLDGGGSATMVIRGLGQYDTGVLNYPTDNKKEDHYGQRRICTQILVTEKK
jgi:hypothetical protein